MDIDSLLQGVMNSKISTLLYNSMGEQQGTETKREAYTGRSAFLSRMRTDAATSRQGAQNMEDAATMVTTAQTGVTSIKVMLDSMRKIATDVKANAHTLTPEQFESFSNQLKDYANQMVKAAQSTEFNGFKLLNGSAGMNNDGVFQLQAGGSSLTEVLTNMLDKNADPTKVLDGEKMNLSNMANQLSMTNGDEAQAAIDLITQVYDRVASLEARYSNDIKSLNSLAVLMESRADTFDTVQKNHESKPKDEPPSYLDMLMQYTGTPGNILSGRG